MRKLTPNTPRVSARRAVSVCASTSGGNIGAPIMPRPPASATAAANAGVAMPGIEANWMGTVQPTRSVKAVLMLPRAPTRPSRQESREGTKIRAAWCSLHSGTSAARTNHGLHGSHGFRVPHHCVRPCLMREILVIRGGKFFGHACGEPRGRLNLGGESWNMGASTQPKHVRASFVDLAALHGRHCGSGPCAGANKRPR